MPQRLLRDGELRLGWLRALNWGKGQTCGRHTSRSCPFARRRLNCWDGGRPPGRVTPVWLLCLHKCYICRCGQPQGLCHPHTMGSSRLCSV